MARSDTRLGDRIRRRGRSIRALVLAGHVLVFLAGLATRSARKTTQPLRDGPDPSEGAHLTQPTAQMGQLRRELNRRIALVVGSVVSVIALFCLTAGSTFALLSATKASGSNNLTAGTVTLGTTQTVTCSANGGITPGQALNNCQLPITYTGTTSSYVGLDVLIISDPGIGGTALYTNNSAGLILTVSDGIHSYTIPTTSITGAACSALGGDTNATCFQIKDELAEVTGPSGDAGNTIWSSNDSTTFTLTSSFPVATAGYTSGGTATVTLTAHAIQTGHNGSLAGCTVGSECDKTGPGSGAPSWS